MRPETRSSAATVLADGGRTVGAVLLAAGTGSRFADGNKLLATIDDEPIVRRAVRTLTAAELDGVVAVTGYEATAVEAAIDEVDVTIVRNPAFADGQSTSVARGVDVARTLEWDATVFALGDMPHVAPATADALLAAYREGRGSILPAAYDGKRGNPVLFDACHYDALASVTGDRGGRELIAETDDVALVDVDDPGVLRDVDRVEDLADRS